ncbi:uncharacterized protein LOC111703631 [Eurytemora carolleeae]|uniref:uncharacterized protein LOC111703631 n=1 Tax=Eurytemora carolleeae TaxID=1294199 RepID=UPI000C76D9E6|nr:uncharacterized protein LOC111703631 [Eurytemora carolleeae]|eukprot:XP_023331399.1 uncharacterized protein LOC111703631 [Eurytemora affinis]
MLVELFLKTVFTSISCLVSDTIIIGETQSVNISAFNCLGSLETVLGEEILNRTCPLESSSPENLSCKISTESATILPEDGWEVFGEFSCDDDDDTTQGYGIKNGKVRCEVCKADPLIFLTRTCVMDYFIIQTDLDPVTDRTDTDEDGRYTVPILFLSLITVGILLLLELKKTESNLLIYIINKVLFSAPSVQEDNLDHKNRSSRTDTPLRSPMDPNARRTGPGAGKQTMKESVKRRLDVRFKSMQAPSKAEPKKQINANDSQEPSESQAGVGTHPENNMQTHSDVEDGGYTALERRTMEYPIPEHSMLQPGNYERKMRSKSRGRSKTRKPRAPKSIRI